MKYDIIKVNRNTIAHFLLLRPRLTLCYFEFHSRQDDMQKYVYHPINSFHLMKRASNFWPKIKKHLEDFDDVTISKQEIIFPEKSDFIQGASFGLVNLQIMHKLNMSEMIKGKLPTRYFYTAGATWNVCML